MSLEFRKELVLSTAHMPRWMAEGMDVGVDEQPTDERLVDVSFDAVHYGYLVWVPSDADEDVNKPEELRPALALARKHGCQWIRFDCDGPKVDGLPTWVW